MAKESRWKVDDTHRDGLENSGETKDRKHEIDREQADQNRGVSPAQARAASAKRRGRSVLGRI